MLTPSCRFPFLSRTTGADQRRAGGDQPERADDQRRDTEALGGAVRAGAGTRFAAFRGSRGRARWAFSEPAPGATSNPDDR